MLPISVFCAYLCKYDTKYLFEIYTCVSFVFYGCLFLYLNYFVLLFCIYEYV